MECFLLTESWDTVHMHTPNLCKFGSKCNGKCRELKGHFNHPNQKYCLEINCTNPKCILNHLLDWKGNKKNIKLILVKEFARGIYSVYNVKCENVYDVKAKSIVINAKIKNIISQLVIDNVDLDNKSPGFELVKALEEEIRVSEQLAFAKEDPIRAKQILDMKNEILECRKMRIEEEKILKMRRLKIFFDMKRSCEEYEKFLKRKFQGVAHIYQLIIDFIESQALIIDFIEPQALIIPTFENLERGSLMH